VNGNDAVNNCSTAGGSQNTIQKPKTFRFQHSIKIMMAPMKAFIYKQWEAG